MKEKMFLLGWGFLLFLIPKMTFSQSAKMIYKGKDPNNYVWFNNELWRILRKEKDGTIPLIKNESIGTYSFDKDGRSEFSKTSLKTYLNSVYYLSIFPKDRKFIQRHRFTSNYKSWFGFVGLITIQEYDLAYGKEGCENLEYSNLKKIEQKECIDSNYLNERLGTSNGSWTMSRYKNATYVIKDNYIESFFQKTKKEVFPVVYLKRNIKWKGNGTKEQPYQIEAK